MPRPRVNLTPEAQRVLARVRSLGQNEADFTSEAVVAHAVNLAARLHAQADALVADNGTFPHARLPDLAKRAKLSRATSARAAREPKVPPTDYRKTPEFRKKMSAASKRAWAAGKMDKALATKAAKAEKPKARKGFWAGLTALQRSEEIKKRVAKRVATMKRKREEAQGATLLDTAE